MPDHPPPLARHAKATLGETNGRSPLRPPRGTHSDVVPPGSSLVEIDLVDEAPNGTLLRLTHSGLPNAEQCAGHDEGWAHYIGRLAVAAAGRDPGPDAMAGRTG